MYESEGGDDAEDDAVADTVEVTESVFTELNVLKLLPVPGRKFAVRVGACVLEVETVDVSVAESDGETVTLDDDPDE